ncbi:hypothetical protein [Nocardia sp. NPDC052566]|uniref:hypothetical protein n=1 Tax=Nocardia sp. NPDC052566 TaxID=3364330 RepID=UPI0037CC5FC5
MKRRYPLVAASVAAIVIACSSCAQPAQDHSGHVSTTQWVSKPELTYVSEFPVSEDLSERSAQELAVRHLSEALKSLPGELSLTISDRWGGHAIDPRFVDTCTTDRTVQNAPLGLWINYLVTGAEAPVQQYIDAFRSSWQNLGWKVSNEPAIRTDLIRATTPDHFTLTAMVSMTGELGLALASPCFPNTARGNADPLPSHIAHP